MGSAANVSARAIVGIGALRAAWRDDLSAVVDPVWRHQLLGEPKLLLQALHDPHVLFDCVRLIDLFAEQIIPTTPAYTGAAVEVELR